MKQASRLQTCSKCGITKWVSKFSPDSRRVTGLQSACKACRNQYQREYRKRPSAVTVRKQWRASPRGKNIERKSRRKYNQSSPGKLAKRRAGLKKKYGLSIEEYNSMLAAQSGVCAICHSCEPNRQLAVDHNHETGAVRALLCYRCNAGLGCMNDDVGLLKCALLYLEKHE